MLTIFTFLVVSAALIYWACGFFVNAVEWLGHKMQLSTTATGTVLAALGTALPESVVTFIAVVLGETTQQKQVGVGAALAGPLVLATIAYAVVGWVLCRTANGGHAYRYRIKIDQQRLRRDQRWFLTLFVLKVILGLVIFTGKCWFAFVFLGAYVVYLWRELHDQQPGAQQELAPLKICRRGEPTLRQICLQAAASLAVIAIAAHIFIDYLVVFSGCLGWPTHMAALLLSPIATELPETINAFLWARQGKTELALANISGAMMIQATIPSALGLLFTPWLFDGALLFAAVMTMVAIGLLLALSRKNNLDSRILAAMAGLYAVFVAYLVAGSI